ncbi:oligosaccharide flippase family protein [Thalassobacillus sp. C254]|uniref:oligosaccharide flippase family protein n=1 Tax=Thalassobacillus sp. C254 TaxID=1225341 RepID=UPI0006CFDA72|nr:oligosaccharide flippase family protein [Thalassobacillus sp. C254]
MENRNIPAGSKLIKGALILSAAGLLGKVLSALYRVPYQNLTGDLGYYVYQQIYPFYGAVMVISMYGFPVIISKMMLEDRLHRSKGEEIAAASFILLSLFSCRYVFYCG